MTIKHRVSLRVPQSLSPLSNQKHALLFVHFTQTFIITVDMILAVVVTWACWSWLEWVYPPASRRLPARPPGSPSDRLNPWVIALVAATLLIAGVIIIGGKA